MDVVFGEIFLNLVIIFVPQTKNQRFKQVDCLKNIQMSDA